MPTSPSTISEPPQLGDPSMTRSAEVISGSGASDIDIEASARTRTSEHRRKRKRFTRIRAACERCKARKQKCDLLQPKCSNCIRGRADCVTINGTSRMAPASDGPSPVGDVGQRLRDLEEQLRQVTEGGSNLAQVRHSANNGISTQTLPTDLSPCHHIENSSTGFGSVGEPVGSRRQERSSGLAQLLHQHLRYASPHVRDLGHGPGGNMAGAPSPLDLFATSTPVGGRPLLPRPVRKVPIPPAQEVDRLVVAFFANRWPNYPIFYRSAFLRDIVRPLRLDGTIDNDTTHFFLYMVMAIATLDMSVSSSDTNTPTAFDYYLTATTFHLEGALAADGISSIQSLLLMAMFAMSDPRGVSLWHLTGMISRMCIDFGLHRLSGNDGVLELEVELQRRVFWCAFALERSVAVALGRRPALAVEDITTSLPTPIDDPFAISATEDPPDIAAFIHTLKLRGYNGLILSTLYSPASSVTLSSCLERPPMTASLAEPWRTWMRGTLNEWLKSAPKYPLPCSSTYKTQDWFTIAHAHSMLILYRPSSTHPELSPEAMQICADASMTLISSYLRLYTFAKVTYTWVALHSLYLATITALYTLQQSEMLRRATSYEVVQVNMRGCSILFGAMTTQWPAARHCQRVAESLTAQTLAIFEKDAATSRAAAEEAMTALSRPQLTLSTTDLASHTSASSVNQPIEEADNHFLDIRSDLGAWLDSVFTDQATETQFPDFSNLATTFDFNDPAFDNVGSGSTQSHTGAYGMDGASDIWNDTNDKAATGLTGADLDSLLWMQLT